MKQTDQSYTPTLPSYVVSIAHFLFFDAQFFRFPHVLRLLRPYPVIPLTCLRFLILTSQLLPIAPAPLCASTDWQQPPNQGRQMMSPVSAEILSLPSQSANLKNTQRKLMISGSLCHHKILCGHNTYQGLTARTSLTQWSAHAQPQTPRLNNYVFYHSGSLFLIGDTFQLFFRYILGKFESILPLGRVHNTLF